MILCDILGCHHCNHFCNKESYFELTNPDIFSRLCAYKPTDLGKKGITCFLIIIDTTNYATSMGAGCTSVKRRNSFRLQSNQACCNKEQLHFWRRANLHVSILRFNHSIKWILLMMVIHLMILLMFLLTILLLTMILLTLLLIFLLILLLTIRYKLIISKLTFQKKLSMLVIILFLHNYFKKKLKLFYLRC